MLLNRGPPEGKKGGAKVIQKSITIRTKRVGPRKRRPRWQCGGKKIQYRTETVRAGTQRLIKGRGGRKTPQKEGSKGGRSQTTHSGRRENWWERS